MELVGKGAAPNAVAAFASARWIAALDHKATHIAVDCIFASSQYRNTACRIEMQVPVEFGAVIGATGTEREEVLIAMT